MLTIWPYSHSSKPLMSDAFFIGQFKSSLEDRKICYLSDYDRIDWHEQGGGLGNCKIEICFQIAIEAASLQYSRLHPYPINQSFKFFLGFYDEGAIIASLPQEIVFYILDLKRQDDAFPPTFEEFKQTLIQSSDIALLEKHDELQDEYKALMEML